MLDYDQNRPHKSLGYKTPNEYAALINQNSNFEWTEPKGSLHPIAVKLFPLLKS